MDFRKFFPTVVAAGMLGLFLAGDIFADDDGFTVGEEIQTGHFSVYSAPGVDLSALIGGLAVQSTDEVLAGHEIRAQQPAGSSAAHAIDTFFIRVCDILDMRLYSFHGNIKICPDQKTLAEIYSRFYTQDLDPAVQSFYSYRLNTIYVTREGFTRRVLGHEVAHAVMSHYFVVLPSTRIQEVLAGYVEFQMRKNS